MIGGPWVTLLLVLCAAAAVGAFLYTLAAKIAWEIGVHDLRVEAHRLRIEYAKRLARLRGETADDQIDPSEINVDIIDDDGGPIEMGEAAESTGQRKAA